MSTAPISYTIYYKANQADAWTTADADLFCDRVRFACAPGSNSAILTRDYGYLVQRGSAGAVAAVDLRGRYIKITITDENVNTVDWYGYCPAITDAVDGTHKSPADGTTDTPSGVQTYTVYGMEYLLQREQFRRSYYDNGGTVGTLQVSLPYNQSSSGRNNALAGRRGSSKVDGIYLHNAAGTDTWTALDIIEVLLYDFTQVYGLTFTLAGQYASLANITEPWGELSGDYYSLLKRLINPARGFTFYVSDTTITVVSISDAAIGSYVPANPNVVSLTLDQSTFLRDATITHLDNVHFDTIRVEGEPIRVCFTMSNAYGTLAAGWDSADETAYGSASDADRSKDTYSDVYCRYKLPAGWDGYQNTSKNVMPGIDLTTGDADFTIQQSWFSPELVLDRSLPITDDDDNPKPPLVWVKDADNKYRRVHNPKGGSIQGATVRVLDDGVGIRIDPKYPHCFGLNHFAGTSDDEAVVDWQEVVATVSMYTHMRIAREIAATTPEPGELTRTKLIRIPNAHLWYVVDGTVTDASETALTTQSGNSAVRDDTAIIDRVADMARVYYGRSRAAITIRYGYPGVIDRLGQVIKETYSGGTTTPAGTLLTEIDYDFRALEVSLSTEWTDLDLAGLVRQDMTREKWERRIARIEANLANCPVQTGGGGRGSATGVTAVKLTAKTNDTTYTGNVYANGTDTTATETGATIRVLSIAAGESIPLNSYFPAYKQKWSGTEQWTINVWRDLA